MGRKTQFVHFVFRMNSPLPTYKGVNISFVFILNFFYFPDRSDGASKRRTL